MHKIKNQKDIEHLKEIQQNNCVKCRFADKKTVGTGQPCCTYPGKIFFNKDGICERVRQ